MAVIAAVLIFNWAGLSSRGSARAGGSEAKPVASTLRIGEKVIKVEVAADEKSRVKGLSGRDNLSKDEGLLMIFEKPDKYGIWMKDMKFPIDILWVSKKRVTAIQENAKVPPLGTPEATLLVYHSQVEADMILEVVAGFVDENGIKSGDTAELRR